MKQIDGNAIVYAEGAFNTPNGKTAHGLVRFTDRYKVLGVIDSIYRGKDAGEVLDGKSRSIRIYGSLDEAISNILEPVKYFVIGLAPDGGRLPYSAREVIKNAISKGLNVDSGLHDFLNKDIEIKALAKEYNCIIRDIRKTPGRDELHFFSGKIEKVDCLKIALLGTDSAIGKRTTAWLLVHGFRESGLKAQMIGTGQTAWMQGARYTTIIDSCINDFVSGEIEHTIYQAWINEHPDIIVIEGQGSLMNPAYPGGFEILAAGRPDYVVLQHAPKRMEYDGFPGYKIHPLPTQIKAIELISGKKVIAVAINHEGMALDEIPQTCIKIMEETGLPAFDVLADGPDKLIELVKTYLK